MQRKAPDRESIDYFLLCKKHYFIYKERDRIIFGG